MLVCTPVVCNGGGTLFWLWIWLWCHECHGCRVIRRLHATTRWLILLPSCEAIPGVGIGREGRFSMTDAGEMSKKPTGGRMLLTGIAISLWATVVWLLNVTAYPSFNGFFPLARDIATSMSAVFAIALVCLRLVALSCFWVLGRLSGPFVLLGRALSACFGPRRWEALWLLRCSHACAIWELLLVASFSSAL